MTAGFAPNTRTSRIRADLGIIRPSDVAPTPWANGLGFTRVLAARPSWRISLAEIEGRMLFSPFPGADRVLIPLQASGVSLEIDGDPHSVSPLSGIVFRGEDHVVVEPAARRSSVVNFMTRRSSGRLRWKIGSTGVTMAATDVEAAVLLEGEVSTGADPLPIGTVIGPIALAGVTAAPDSVFALLQLLAP